MGNFVDFFDQQNAVVDNVICVFSENGKYVYLDSCLASDTASVSSGRLPLAPHFFLKR